MGENGAPVNGANLQRWRRLQQPCYFFPLSPPLTRDFFTPEIPLLLPPMGVRKNNRGAGLIGEGGEVILNDMRWR